MVGAPRAGDGTLREQRPPPPGRPPSGITLADPRPGPPMLRVDPHGRPVRRVPPWPRGTTTRSLEANHHDDPGPPPAGQLGGDRPQPRQPGAAGRGRRARRAARRRPGPDPGRLRRAGHRRRLRGRPLPAGLGGLGRAGRRHGQRPAGPAAVAPPGPRPRAGGARDDAAAARGRPLVRRPDRLADRPGRGGLGDHLGPQRRPRPGPLGPHPRQPDRGDVHRPGRPDPDRGRRPAGGQRPRPRVRQHRRRPVGGRRRAAGGGHHPDRARPDLRPLGDQAGPPAGRGAPRADPLRGPRRDGRPPARLGAAHPGPDPAGRRLAGGGRPGPPAGAGAAGLAVPGPGAGRRPAAAGRGGDRDPGRAAARRARRGRGGGRRPARRRRRALVDACQEAAFNAARHSGAPLVSVYVEVEPDELTGFVRDEGKGFDPDAGPDRPARHRRLDPRPHPSATAAASRSSPAPARAPRSQLRLPRSRADRSHPGLPGRRPPLLPAPGVRAELGARFEIVGEAGEVDAAADGIRRTPARRGAAGRAPARRGRSGGARGGRARPTRRSASWPCRCRTRPRTSSG